MSVSRCAEEIQDHAAGDDQDDRDDSDRVELLAEYKGGYDRCRHDASGAPRSVRHAQVDAQERTMQPNAGSSFVKPSEVFNNVVAMISSMIAVHNSIYCIFILHFSVCGTTQIILCVEQDYNENHTGKLTAYIAAEVLFFQYSMRLRYSVLPNRHCTFRKEQSTI